MKLLIASLALATSGSVFGALIYDFEGANYVEDSALPDPPWTSSEDPSNPVDFVVLDDNGTPMDLSDDNKFGAIGTFGFNPDNNGGLSATVSAPISDIGLTAGGGSPYPALFFDYGILDSFNEDVGDESRRNDFSVSYTNLSSTLITVFFTPNSQTTTPEADTDATWQISYQFGGDLTPTVSAFFVKELDINNIGFVFTDDRVILTIQGATIASGTPIGYDDDAVNNGEITFGTAVGDEGVFGTNISIFDNIEVGTAVPEASTALLSGFAALGLLRRRRKN